MVCPLRVSGLITDFLKAGRIGKAFAKPLNIAMESVLANSRI